MIQRFAIDLSVRIRQGLPGLEAHARMAPVSRVMRTFVPEDFPDARTGCVLVLFYPEGSEVMITLTRRPDYDGVHAGQVSFPGGKREEGDADEYAAAVRETEEEVGVPSELIKPIGKLSNVYIPPSNFFVHPFTAYLDEKPVFVPDVREVAEMIALPVTALLDEHCKGSIAIDRPDAQFTAPCYHFGSSTIWGATAIILAEVEQLVREIR